MLILRDGDIVPTRSRALVPRAAIPADVSLSIMRHNSKPYASQPEDENSILTIYRHEHTRRDWDFFSLIY